MPRLAERIDNGDGTASLAAQIMGTIAPTVSIVAGSSATANGTVLDNTAMKTNHTMAVTSSAGVSAGVVQLQVSQDGVNWFVGGSVTTSTANTVFAATATGAWRYVRAAITTTIVGGTVAATVASV